LLQIPGSNGEFIAVQHFFPGFKSEGAKLVWGRRDANSGWVIKDLALLPFIHRFDMFRVEDEIHILAATLCGSKSDREDWSSPGTVYAGKLPASPEYGVRFTPVLGNLYKNHGYCRSVREGREAGLITCDSGIYALLPPSEKECEWSSEHLLEAPVGDVAVCDLDGDGDNEFVTIEPFHGDKFLVRKKCDGEYRIIYNYPGKVEFAHAITGCVLRGKQSVACGARRGYGELFILQHENLGRTPFHTTLIDSGAGPANVAVVNQRDRDIIISANHSAGEAALYFVTD